MVLPNFVTSSLSIQLVCVCFAGSLCFQAAGILLFYQRQGETLIKPLFSDSERLAVGLIAIAFFIM